MKIQFKKAASQDLEKVFEIRKKVFVEEQKVSPEEEYDEFENISEHFLVEADGKPVACSRWRKVNGKAKIERCAVLKEFRRKGVGRFLVFNTIQQIPQHLEIYLHAQTHAVPFYEKLGFQKVGELFYEANIPHYKMIYRKNKKIIL